MFLKNCLLFNHQPGSSIAMTRSCHGIDNEETTVKSDAVRSMRLIHLSHWLEWA